MPRIISIILLSMLTACGAASGEAPAIGRDNLPLDISAYQDTRRGVSDIIINEFEPTQATHIGNIVVSQQNDKFACMQANSVLVWNPPSPLGSEELERVFIGFMPCAPSGSYYIGVQDILHSRWQWWGPFSDSQNFGVIRIGDPLSGPVDIEWQMQNNVVAISSANFVIADWSSYVWDED